MAKILSIYENNVDRAWYDSSNILYSECLDNPNDFKTLTIVFTTGTKYKYYDVDVNDYLLFREALSQGKEFNRLIKTKGYKYEKVENADIGLLKETLEYYMQDGYVLERVDGKLVIKEKTNVVYESEKEVDKETFMMIRDILLAVNVKIVGEPIDKVNETLQEGKE